MQGSDDLRRTVDIARSVTNLVKPLSLSRRVTSQAVIEQAAIAGAFKPDIIADAEQGQQTADYIARRLDAVSPPLERGWTGRADAGRRASPSAAACAACRSATSSTGR